MSAMSLKEKAAASVAVVVLLYALGAAVFFVAQLDAWKKAARTYSAACAAYERECRLISQKDRWIEAYEEERSRMPLFGRDRATDTTWLQKTDEIAARNFIQIQSRQNGKETRAGEVLELPITGTGWEGSLDSLVKFMYELETTDEGMFDISAISFKPNTAKKGFLRGSFTLTCAYMRGDEK